MTGQMRIAAVVVLGAGVALVGARTAMAQTLKAQERPKVAAQIIQPDQEDEFTKGALPQKTVGLVAPILRHQTNPKYTPVALRAKIEGDVKLQAVIGVDGRVEKARVKEGLHPELDLEALNALDQWQFEPGRIDGQPARVLIEVVMAFRVR